MTPPPLSFQPPHCPRPSCPSHASSAPWRFKRIGFYTRRARPHRIQRFLCLHCRVSFSSQTFSTTYWLKRPDLLHPLFLRSLGCSAFRQIARDLDVSPSTVAGQVLRLGRHCLLYHEAHRPPGPPAEPVVLDGFESFEYSQYHPCHFHVAVGADSHFFYAFTDSELRRKGRMTAYQRRRRAELEERWGRPDPKSIEKEMARCLALATRGPCRVEVRTDEHPAYPGSWRRLERAGWSIGAEVTSSQARRTASNPLFAVNRLDLWIRHAQANHKRETIAFSKRRASAGLRLAVLQVWLNWMKAFSERRRDASPAERLGLRRGKATVREVLRERLFPWRVRLPGRVEGIYRMEARTRLVPRGRVHRLVFAD